ncbi:type III pantothenate kinase [Rickettsiales bacterium]|nr:type III pantothenate kinase [Rickettsiales bacterium]
MLILAIDIGNTNSFFCFFKEEKLVENFRIPVTSITSRNVILKSLKKSRYIKNLNGVIISSVVPKFNDWFKKVFKEKFNKNPIFVEKIINKLDLKTKIKKKKSIGADRLVNVFYAMKIYSSPILIVDFGTATTIDYVNKNKIYEGAIIAPGINLSLKSLHQFTAKLPLIKFTKTKSIIGNNTESAIKSGFYWGYISMVNGVLKKIIKEKKIKPKIIITGGNSVFFKNHIKGSILDELFTMKGLNLIYRRKVLCEK